jgi:hypothetical protein
VQGSRRSADRRRRRGAPPDGCWRSGSLVEFAHHPSRSALITAVTCSHKLCSVPPFEVCSRAVPAFRPLFSRSSAPPVSSG